MGLSVLRRQPGFCLFLLEGNVEQDFWGREAGRERTSFQGPLSFESSRDQHHGATLPYIFPKFPSCPAAPTLSMTTIAVEAATTKQVLLWNVSVLLRFWIWAGRTLRDTMSYQGIWPNSTDKGLGRWVLLFPVNSVQNCVCVCVCPFLQGVYSSH